MPLFSSNKKGKVAVLIIFSFFIVLFSGFFIGSGNVPEPQEIGQFYESYQTKRLAYEEPFNLEVYPSTIKINRTEKSLTIDGRFWVDENASVPEGNKYLGFSFGALLSDGDIWYRNYGSDDAPVHLGPNDFSHLESYETPIGDFNHAYYTTFPNIPPGTDKEFRLKFFFAEKPKSFVMYFGTGSTIINTTTQNWPWQSSQRTICKDSSGSLHVVWRYSSTSVGYANSSDGVTWTSNTSFINGSAGNKRGEPAVSCDGNNITVAYEDTTLSDLMVAISEDGGASWTWKAPRTSGLHATSPNTVVVERRGQRIYIIYDTVTSDYQFFNSSDGGNTWGSDIELFDNSYLRDVSIAVDGDGGASDKIYVVATVGILPRNIQFRNSSNSGVSWSAAQTIIPNAFHSIITFNESNLYVAGNHADHSIYYVNSSDRGITWSSVINISVNGSQLNFYPSVTLNSTGHPIVLWQSNASYAGYDYNIVYKSFNGSEWSTMANLTEEPSWTVNSPYTYYGDNKIHFVWKNDTGTPPEEILYDYISIGGAEITRNITQSFTTNNIIDEVGGFFKTIPQAFSINSLIDRLISAFRTTTQSFAITSVVDRSRVFTRTIIQRINIFPPQNNTYNFSGTFDSKAWNNTVAEEPPGTFTPAGETEINYAKIETSDDDHATDSSITEYPYHKFNMSITESNVNYVDVLWEGYTSSTGNISLYVWNYTLGNWSLLDYGNDTADFNLTARVSDLNNVRMGTGNITFLVQDGG